MRRGRRFQPWSTRSTSRFDAPLEIARWRPLCIGWWPSRNRLSVGLRLFWLIPIGFFLGFVSIVASVVASLGFFAVLFTGRWPEGMRSFLIGTGRLSARVNAYAYLLVDDYPTFALS